MRASKSISPQLWISSGIAAVRAWAVGMRPPKSSPAARPAITAPPEIPSLVIRPYTPLAKTRDRARRRITLGVSLFCFLYGAFFALTAPYLIIAMLMPMALLVGLIIWALPDLPNPPVKLLEGLFFAFLIGLVMWPNYIAIALPGLPWLTVARLTSAPMALILLICVSTSPEFRATISHVISRNRYVFTPAVLLFIYQAISIAFSANKAGSVDAFINAQTGPTAALFTAAYVFSKTGRSKRFATLLCVMAGILSVMGIWEYKLDRILWAGHIPSFLKIQDPLVERILAGTFRGHGPHRVQDTFSTSLGLAEFLGGIAFPFVWYTIVEKNTLWIRFLAIVAAPLVIWTVVLTQARVGLIGVAGTMILYPCILVFKEWRQNRFSLTAASGLFLSPLFVLIAGAVGMAVPGIRIRLLGGGQAQLSNIARGVQWHMGIPKLLSQPWGHGIGQGALSLGYYSAAGGLTIDSYTLRLAMEYGVIGFLLFYFIYTSGVYTVIVTIIKKQKQTSETNIITPLVIAMTNYIVIKSVFAQEDNLSMMYAIIGCLCSIHAKLEPADKY